MLDNNFDEKQNKNKISETLTSPSITLTLLIIPSLLSLNKKQIQQNPHNIISNTKQSNQYGSAIPAISPVNIPRVLATMVPIFPILITLPILLG
jgi:hypothetical protein